MLNSFVSNARLSGNADEMFFQERLHPFEFIADYHADAFGSGECLCATHCFELAKRSYNGDHSTRGANASAVMRNEIYFICVTGFDGSGQSRYARFHLTEVNTEDVCDFFGVIAHRQSNSLEIDRSLC